MPINNWNWYRTLNTGNDHKGWLEDNPQIEDGRDGGNIGFEDDDRNQYEDECSHMMTKLKLNVYRAEDEFITMQRIQWRKEEEESRKERKKVEKEMAALRTQQNREWRERREEEKKEKESSGSCCEVESVCGVEEALREELRCPSCTSPLLPPSPVYQCEDGHVLCYMCRALPGLQECPECSGPLVGRNTLVESIAAIVFARELDMSIASEGSWEDGSC